MCGEDAVRIGDVVKKSTRALNREAERSNSVFPHFLISPRSDRGVRECVCMCGRERECVCVWA